LKTALFLFSGKNLPLTLEKTPVVTEGYKKLPRP